MRWRLLIGLAASGLALAALLVAALIAYSPGHHRLAPAPSVVADGSGPRAPLFMPRRADDGPELVSWVDGAPITDWTAEAAKRQQAIEAYLYDTDPENAAQYGFREGQTPALAWYYFQHNPVGFNGLPFVLLKTIMDLDPDHEHPALRRVAQLWRQEASVPGPDGAPELTVDHLGLSPHPDDYVDGIVRPPAERRAPLPYGLAWENPLRFEPLSALETAWLDLRLRLKWWFTRSSLLIARMRTGVHDENWEADRPSFGTPGYLDRVHFSCAACHVGRVVVDGRMTFLPGMPNTEVEAQLYSRLLMETAAAFVESGFDPFSTSPVDPGDIVPDQDAVLALYVEMLDKGRTRPETLYGSSPADIARAKIQTVAVADEFPSVIQDLVALGVKTHFIYQVVAKPRAYRGDRPDLFADRSGQMDAFGIAAGLVAIHALRPDNSFLEFIRRDNPDSPFFAGFSRAKGLPEDIAGMTEPVTDTGEAARRIVDSLSAWAPPVPGTIDMKSVNWVIDNFHANWDGNQGASSRTLSSGASATGDPRMVNVRIHEPLNPFINYLPPPPYPFLSVDLERARQGKAIFAARCATCHRPQNDRIYPAAALGVDVNRTLVNTSVSRYGLAALVMEACTIYGLNNAGRPGADWCMPEGSWEEKLDDYFRDTPARAAAGTAGYKADALAGNWAQAPYLHNGSAPTLGHLICPDTRPERFLRGNLHYDEALVGFEWAVRPEARYAPHETLHVREYDTSLAGNANTGHLFGSDLCPSTHGLDPVRDRDEIGRRLLDSRVGALLEYLKTL